MEQMELLSLIALQHIPGIGSITAKRLLDATGSATALFEQRTELPSKYPEFRTSIIKHLDCPAAHQRAEQALEFIEKHRIT